LSKGGRKIGPVIVVVAHGTDIYMTARTAAALGMAVERVLPAARILNGYCAPAILESLRGIQGVETADEARAYSSRALNCCGSSDSEKEAKP
jgi:hypothetical protein